MEFDPFVKLCNILPLYCYNPTKAWFEVASARIFCIIARGLTNSSTNWQDLPYFDYLSYSIDILLLTQNFGGF